MTDPAYPDALPGLFQLHWYVIERVLGQGGFGITYLARDTNLDQTVAIKEYLPVDVATRMPDATIRSRTEELRDRYRWGLERFIQEARTLARFDHPNIVRVQSVFEFNNTAYMVMRFEQGLTLSALLDRRGTLPEQDLLRVIMPILDGLELVHAAGFIHRDIKPDNIHINDNGDPVLLDFGSARQSLGNAHTLTILIAPGYAPFEQYYSDSSSQGPWTDIYGLAATCYRAISGRAPLDAVSRSKGILGSAQEILVPASVIGAGRYSGRFLTAIDHALAFAEKDRPQSIAAWRRELTCENEQPTAAAAIATPPVRESPDSRPSAASHVRKTLLIGSVIAAAILAMGVVVYVATTRTGDETRSKIDKLEKQLQDKERAEVDRIAQQQRDDEARKREDQARVDAAEATRKRELDERARQEELKRRETEAAKLIPSPNYNAKTKQPPAERAQLPAASPTIPPAAPREAPAAPTTAQPPLAPEAAKPSSPPPPREQLADADRMIAAKHFAEALAILRPLADAGNAQAQTRLGNAYADGQGVQRDVIAAREWYEKAARQGEIGAALKLGAMFTIGSGTDRNSNLAYVYFGMAARLGSTAAKPEMEKAAASLQPAERQQADRLIDSIVSKMSK